MPSHLRVAVVSSEPDNGRELESILSECGLDPVLATTLKEARSLLARRDVSLVFCDMELEDGTFRDLLRLTHAAEIPMVVASRVCDTPEYLEAMRMGAFDLVAAAPYRRSEVKQIVASALHRPLAAAACGAGGFSAGMR